MRRDGLRALLILLIIMTIVAGALVVLMHHTGLAEEADYGEICWVICNPKSFVNIRVNPSGRSDVGGRAECADRFCTDGVKKKGFVHVDAPIEAGDGWISERYIVYSEPVYVGKVCRIESSGRVACREYIGGDRTRWLRDGDEVTVYWMAEWAVTNKGFIQSEYIRTN